MNSNQRNSEYDGRGVSRRTMLRAIPMAIGGAIFADVLATPLLADYGAVRLTDCDLGLLARNYLIGVAGPNSRQGYDMAKYLDSAWIQRTGRRLPGSVSTFHADYAWDHVIIQQRRESQTQSGAYVRTDRWIYYDSESPRDFKDVNTAEMACALEPEIIHRLEGIPFPCGPRRQFVGGWEREYQATLDLYRNYHKVDLGKLDLEYVRPAQTMARLEKGKQDPVFTFGVVDKESAPIKRALLFGPEAT